MDVLSGTDISGQVIALIEGARKYVVLVTPYFDPWPRLTTAIKAARAQHGVRVRLLLRGGEDKAKQDEKAAELRAFGVEVSFLERLHAKIYLSESQAIVTSMNLLKSSALDSWEIAMRADVTADAATYGDVAKHTLDLLKRAEADRRITSHAQVANAVASVAAVLGDAQAALAKLTSSVPKVTPSTGVTTRKRISGGHCIRCGGPIVLDPAHPLCAECYKSWARYKKPDYEEKHCHACGKEKKTSMAKPLCRPCWEASA